MCARVYMVIGCEYVCRCACVCVSACMCFQVAQYRLRSFFRVGTFSTMYRCTTADEMADLLIENVKKQKIDSDIVWVCN